MLLDDAWKGFRASCPKTEVVTGLCAGLQRAGEDCTMLPSWGCWGESPGHLPGRSPLLSVWCSPQLLQPGTGVLADVCLALITSGVRAGTELIIVVVLTVAPFRRRYRRGAPPNPAPTRASRKARRNYFAIGGGLMAGAMIMGLAGHWPVSSPAGREHGLRKCVALRKRIHSGSAPARDRGSGCGEAGCSGMVFVGMR